MKKMAAQEMGSHNLFKNKIEIYYCGGVLFSEASQFNKIKATRKRAALILFYRKVINLSFKTEFLSENYDSRNSEGLARAFAAGARKALFCEIGRVCRAGTA
jgi:hypothetical protein